MQNEYGKDHPRRIQLYIFSLWTLMVEPYQKHAKELFDYLDKTSYPNSKDSKEYMTYQIQKALFSKTAISNKLRISLISQYLYSEELNTKNKKVAWLESHIQQSENYPIVVKAFLNLWLLEFHENISIYNNYCQGPIIWINEQQLALKVDLIEQCVNVAEHYGYTTSTDLVQIQENIRQQIDVNTHSVENFVFELTNSFVTD